MAGRDLLQDGANQAPWSQGGAGFFSYEVEGHRYFVGIRCRLGTQETSEIAQLDTAAQWSVVGGEVAEELINDLQEVVDEQIQMSTRLGTLHGSLRRLRIELLADAGLGANVLVDATVAVLPDWTGPVMLGFHGFLERLRVAIDPGAHAAMEPRIFFGAYE